MNFKKLVQESTQLRLFHGSAYRNLSSILKRGLDKGENQRVYFSTDTKYAYGIGSNSTHHSNLWVLVEVVAKLGSVVDTIAIEGMMYGEDPIPGFVSDRLASEVLSFSKILKDIDRELLFYSSEYRPEERKYHSLKAKLTRALKITNSKDMNLPVPINFRGGTRIVAVYVVDGRRVKEVAYGGGSLRVGSVV